jgi:hypothetical protein
VPLFDPCYRLIVGPPGGTGKELVSGQRGEVSLRITFDIERTTAEKPNRSRITIYNLSPETRALMEKPDNKCVLYAGYTESDGPQLMFTGNVTFAFTQRDGPDFATTIELGDGHVPLRDTVISVGMGKGASAHQIMGNVASQMGVPLNLADGAPDRSWAHGLSFYGPARVILGKVASATGLEWSMQNEALQVIERGGTTSRKAIVIGPDSGMIRSPQRRREGAKQVAQVKDQTPGSNQHIKTVTGERPMYNGWQVDTLLMPTINPGDTVKLESLAATGFFRVDTVKHMGDSFRGDWRSQFDLLDAKDYAEKVAAQNAAKAKKQTAAAKRAAKGAGHH